MNRNDCEFNRRPDVKRPDAPCFQCGLGVMRKLRKECPFLAKVGEVERAKADDAIHYDSLLTRVEVYRGGIRDVLKDVREYRDTSEPKNSDKEEIRRLIEKIKRLEREVQALQEEVDILEWGESSDKVG